MASQSNRAGAFVAQPSGYRAFIPAPLPRSPRYRLMSAFCRSSPTPA